MGLAGAGVLSWLMRTIAVVTSGGDAPGMNAAVRAVVRSCAARGWRALGIRRGYAGLIEEDARELGPRDVGGTMQTGGTLLGSARAPEFATPEGLRRGIGSLGRLGVSGLVVVGGNGSQQGSAALAREGVPVAGVASTIDDDLVGSEPTLGFDTALNVVLESVDRLRVTATSLRRMFLVEVMGRDCGRLALAAAVSGGAEAVSLPERPLEPGALESVVRAAYDRGKPHAVVIVAEGARHGAESLARHFAARREDGLDARVTVLGHVQRGGRPTYFDRMLGTRLGEAAVESLARGEDGRLLGWLGGRVASTPLAEVAGRVKGLDPDLLRLADVMAL